MSSILLIKCTPKLILHKQNSNSTSYPSKLCCRAGCVSAILKFLLQMCVLFLKKKKAEVLPFFGKHLSSPLWVACDYGVSHAWLEILTFLLLLLLQFS